METRAHLLVLRVERAQDEDGPVAPDRLAPRTVTLHARADLVGTRSVDERRLARRNCRRTRARPGARGHADEPCGGGCRAGWRRGARRTTRGRSTTGKRRRVPRGGPVRGRWCWSVPSGMRSVRSRSGLGGRRARRGTRGAARTRRPGRRSRSRCGVRGGVRGRLRAWLDGCLRWVCLGLREGDGEVRGREGEGGEGQWWTGSGWNGLRVGQGARVYFVEVVCGCR